MATYATQDDLNALASLVRTLENNVTTLDDSVGELDSLVDRINHVEALKDVTITYITEGDVLQYSSDGTWHNVQPALLNINAGDAEGSPVDSNIVKALILSEGAKLFLSKTQDDTALGQITFRNGLVSNRIAYFNQGLEVGNYVPGFLGSGAKIDKDGRAELQSLVIREFLEVPELRFNKIDVVSGELWNSIAYGTIESVDTVNQIATVKLEEGEYSGLQINDICRGIFHNLTGGNETVEKEDEFGFQTVRGFGTSYFTPTEIIGVYGEKFRYALAPNCRYHPQPQMKFAVYGNFTDETRQSSAYSTRTYKRFLKDVNTWSITWENIASQFGLLDGLNIPGAPNNGDLEGDGAYLTNVYMTGAMIQFTPAQEESLKGKDGYSVSLTRYETTVIVDNDFNVITDYQQSGQMEFGIQAFKGPTELTYDNVYGEGKYFVEYNAVGCNVTFDNGVFRIQQITAYNSEMYIDIMVNCEGMVTFKAKFFVNYQLEGNSVWVTYYDGDELPAIPTGDGTSNGWHLNFTSTAIWMSSKSSRKINEGVWGDPVRFVGASVAGKDGQYTAFAYTNSSVQPATPTSTSTQTIPPLDPNGLLTWEMFPPERANNSVYTWMSQATVYSDKTLSGWTSPIRLTGDDGQDGVDGLSLEFIYQVTTEPTAPTPPTSPPNQDDPDLTGTGWTDNPQGVSKDAMYEWVAQRKKERDEEGVATWGPYTTPVLWSKWGEKGMDGDGYEYIYTRTADVDIVPNTPTSKQQDDFKPIVGDGSDDYNWSDDPKGIVNEEYKAEWVCVRKKTDGVWSNYSTPALWSNWGEQGMQGAHYIYRWTVSTTTPEYESTATNPNKGTTEWVNDSEIQATETDEFVWQIQCLSNPDGTQGEWGNLIRLTGANGKDGEDGNSIEFLYARNNTGITPSTPPTTQEPDWEGTVEDTNNDTTVTWYDNPQGVTANIMYEYVCQRYFDKTTQLWGDYSTPGIWARYSEKGKDGDGYEYIYRTFFDYQEQSAVSSGGTYYPSLSDYTDSSGVLHNYQEDDFVPPNYTDNPVGTSTDMIYEYVWTRKKKDGVWGAWSNGAMWSRYAADGKTYSINGCPSVIYSSNGTLQTTSIELAAIYTENSVATAISGYWAAYYKDSSGTWNLIQRPASTLAVCPLYWDASIDATEFWFGFTVDPIDAPYIAPDYPYATWSTTIPVVYEGAAGSSGVTYSISPGFLNLFETSAGSLEPSTVNFKCYKSYTDSSGTVVTEPAYVYWELYGGPDPITEGGNSQDTEVQYSSGPVTTFDANFLNKSTLFDYYWLGVSPVNWPDTPSEGVVASMTIRVTKQSETSSSYVIMRYRGTYTSTTWPGSSETFYYTDASTAGESNYQGDAIIRDYVSYENNVYFVKSYSSSGISGSYLPTNTTYWEVSSKQNILTVNNLLAGNAKLGAFNFSNNVFWSGNGTTASSATLYMNSSTGEFKCTNATITGTITADYGKIGGFTIVGNSLSNEDANDDASIMFTNTTYSEYAWIGGNVLNAVLGYRGVARFENRYDNGLYPGSINCTMVVSTQNAEQNVAISLGGGYIQGFALKTKVIGLEYITQSTAPSSMYVSLDRLVGCVFVTTQFYWRSSSSVTEYEIATRDVYITLPTMDVYDDGHVIKIKRGSNDSKYVYISPGGSYRMVGNVSTGTYTRTYGTSFILYDRASYGTTSSRYPLASQGHAVEFVYVRDYSVTIDNVTYYGGWIEYKHPRDW